MTPEQIATASAETERLAHNLDITNVDHVALWLDENLSDASPIWLACRIVEAHEAILAALKAQLAGEDMVRDAIYQLAYHQQQADMDGCMVTVSGQALDEVLVAIAAMQESRDD